MPPLGAAHAVGALAEQGRAVFGVQTAGEAREAGGGGGPDAVWRLQGVTVGGTAWAEPRPKLRGAPGPPLVLGTHARAPLTGISVFFCQAHPPAHGPPVTATDTLTAIILAGRRAPAFPTLPLGTGEAGVVSTADHPGLDDQELNTEHPTCVPSPRDPASPLRQAEPASA